MHLFHSSTFLNIFGFFVCSLVLQIVSAVGWITASRDKEKQKTKRSSVTVTHLKDDATIIMNSAVVKKCGEQWV